MSYNSISSEVVMFQNELLKKIKGFEIDDIKNAILSKNNYYHNLLTKNVIELQEIINDKKRIITEYIRIYINTYMNVDLKRFKQEMIVNENAYKQIESKINDKNEYINKINKWNKIIFILMKELNIKYTINVENNGFETIIIE